MPGHLAAPYTTSEASSILDEISISSVRQTSVTFNYQDEAGRELHTHLCKLPRLTSSLQEEKDGWVGVGGTRKHTNSLVFHSLHPCLFPSVIVLDCNMSKIRMNPLLFSFFKSHCFFYKVAAYCLDRH